jgi:hypothetical protein
MLSLYVVYMTCRCYQHLVRAEVGLAAWRPGSVLEGLLTAISPVFYRRAALGT